MRNLLLVLQVLLMTSLPIQAAENSTWLIESRAVPPPQGASEILRNSIAGTPQPDVEASSGSPQTNAEWIALIESIATQIPLQLIEQTLNLTIEKDVIAGVPVFAVTPQEIRAEHKDHVFLYAHGGAYVFNGGDAAISESAIVAAMGGMKAVSVDYRMPPSNPFPSAVEDMVAVYLDLLNTYDSGSIAVGGSSAGAGLTMATLHRLKELEEPLPGVLFAGSPWADLSKTGDTLFTNEGIDRILVTYDGYLKGAAELYAGDNDLSNPLLSPLYGDFAGFPPTILVSGTRDLFLSDTVRVHRKLRAAGVVADLHVYEAISHTGYGFMRQAEESQNFYSELIKFIDHHLE